MAAAVLFMDKIHAWLARLPGSPLHYFRVYQLGYMQKCLLMHYENRLMVVLGRLV